MRVTFAQAGMPLSMGLFFTLLVVGLNAKVPSAMYSGLLAHGVPLIKATELSHLPPLGYIFAAFLGLNPLKSLLGPSVLSHLSAAHAAALTSRSFFPHLIGPPFKHGLVMILAVTVVMSVVAAIASALRGEKFVHGHDESIAQKAQLHHQPHHVRRHADHVGVGRRGSGRARINEPGGATPTRRPRHGPERQR